MVYNIISATQTKYGTITWHDNAGQRPCAKLLCHIWLEWLKKLARSNLLYPIVEDDLITHDGVNMHPQSRIYPRVACGCLLCSSAGVCPRRTVGSGERVVHQDHQRVRCTGGSLARERATEGRFRERRPRDVEGCDWRGRGCLGSASVRPAEHGIAELNRGQFYSRTRHRQK